jgi:HAD superfamily hydrolase (TIGR01509 family)
VFDFDGVIADSEPLHLLGFRSVLNNVGVELSESEYFSRYLGYDDAGVFLALAAEREINWTSAQIDALVERKAERLEELERQGSVLFPGAADAIERLSKRCPLAIASGALGREILRVLEREDLRRYFAAVIAAEDTPAGKPAPDPYLGAVTRLSSVCGGNLEPASCAAVEDSQWGLQSARAAGLWTVGVTHTYPASALAAAHAIVPHLDHLTWEFVQTLPHAGSNG